MLKILTLNRPYILQAKNELTKLEWQKASFRSVLFLLLCSIIAIGLFLTTKQLLIEVENLSSYIYLPYEQILGLFLLFLLFALTISNIAICLGRFYHSNDLDLFLAAPISFISFFTSRLIAVCMASSWMPALFLAPVLLAFMQKTGQNSLYSWAQVAFIFAPYFVLPTACSVILAIVFLYFAPKNYGKIISYGLITLGFWLAYKVISVVRATDDSLTSVTGILRAVNVLALPQVDWLPTNWAARCFSNLLNAQPVITLPEFQQLYCATVLTLSIGYILSLLLYDNALARERGARNAGIELSNFVATLLQRVFSASKFRALIFKEFALIFRETAQVVQLLLLLVLGYLYIYNLETLASATEFTIRFDAAWTRFLGIVSLAVGCFFILAISTRIIFPSISLEGRSFWLLMSRPIIPEQIILIKFWIWVLPLGIIAAVFFVMGAMALQIQTILLPAMAVFGFVSAYGIVGLAIGMGAKYANFDWEYSTQLVASFGSILYMLTAITFLTIICIPFGCLVLVVNFPLIALNMSIWGQGMLFFFIVFGIWLPTQLSVNVALGKGIQELKSRLS